MMILIVDRPHASIDKHALGGAASTEQYGGRVAASLQWTAAGDVISVCNDSLNVVLGKKLSLGLELSSPVQNTAYILKIKQVFFLFIHYY